MAIVAGRTGFQEQLTLATKETAFNAKDYANTADGAGAVHGVPLKGVEISAITEDCWVYIHGLNSVTDRSDGASEVIPERVVAGTTIQRYAYEGRAGLINKIEVEPVAAAGKVSWSPLMI